LREYQMVLSSGRTRGTTYRIHPRLLQESGYKGKTSLLDIEDHRLRELILTNLRRYPGSAIGAIHERIGVEIPRSRIQRHLRGLLQEGLIQMRGTRRWASYEPVK
jgi:ATP-dependent DNA helicase RecG